MAPTTLDPYRLPRGAVPVRYDIELDELRAATGFEFIALRDSAVEALLGSLGAELSFLSVRLKDLFLPEAAQLSSSVERLAIAAIGGAKEGQHA